MGFIRRIKKKRQIKNELTKHIGEVLLHLRQKKNSSMRDVSNGSGLSTAFICQIENGESSPSADTLVKLSAFFSVSVGYFFKDFDFEKFLDK